MTRRTWLGEQEKKRKVITNRNKVRGTRSGKHLRSEDQSRRTMVREQGQGNMARGSRFRQTGQSY